MIVKPNLFIVGAAKSGTTSLWNYLKQHPEVFMPEDELNKEPAYFSSISGDLQLQSYLNLFSKAGKDHAYIGEASTAYLTDPISAGRIHCFNPDSKIIIILRNPAERAYSLYNWMVQDGYEFSERFEDALQLEVFRRSVRSVPNWYEPQYFWNYMYFESGLYVNQVKRYIELFGGKSVLVLKFEALISSPKSVLQQICNFLNISYIEGKFQKENPSRKVYSASIQFILRKITDYVLANRSINVNQLISIVSDAETRLSRCVNYDYKKRVFLRDLLLSILDTIQTNDYVGIFETKKERDILLNFGILDGRPERLSVVTKNVLNYYYKNEINILRSYMDTDLNDWPSV